MNIVVLKCILLGVMALTTVVFGLIPIKLMAILSNKSGKAEQRASFVISLLSCFAGGVFLAVCFLDLMPDANSAYDEWAKSADYTSDYPFVPLFFCVGFFVVKLLEEIIGKFCGHEEHVEERRKHAATFVSVVENNTSEFDDSCSMKIVKSLTFVVALMFHASLEGFAFGVQETTISVASLFCGIIVHKAVVSFSVGMRLVEAHPNRLWVVVILVVAIALVTPIGGVIGIVLEVSHSIHRVDYDNK
ncbi:unnamed protein product [Nippostrongylus brasiliensis]|uniref:Zinc transporter ZIP2 (inferred by orthology to a human protein) n=1 Tax=Nippostrongylus brasiliensis TaxID=27835 RepID=A0A0N4XF08_NIPBR|nr:unnamed protein product [Nippostrongylus brasiliensis]